MVNDIYAAGRAGVTFTDGSQFNDFYQSASQKASSLLYSGVGQGHYHYEITKGAAESDLVSDAWPAIFRDAVSTMYMN
ncbi:MAG: hypothetical protein Q9227_001833 [Pyrenula ochraceoflavens]